MASGGGEDPLAYGDDHGAPPQKVQEAEGQEGDRGIIGDTYRKLRSQYDANSGSKPSSGGGLGSMLFHKLHDAVNEISNKLDPNSGTEDVKHSHTHAGAQCTDGMHDTTQHRYGSFASQRNGNDAKCNTDVVTKTLTGIGLAATFLSLEHVEKENPLIVPPLTVCSYHTKHALEALHPNISVFRHPDHLPDAQTLQSSFISSLQHISLSAKKAAELPTDALKAIYGMNEDVILYWAHHEKLCLVDGSIAFMGGLDLCHGRWDTNQHPLADCHPSNLEDIVFPGQDYNNARIMDFQDVSHYQENALNRKDSSRMGWSDLSISLHGPVVEDLRAHFVERWNFIYNEKYDVRKDVRYSRLTFTQNAAGTVNNQDISAPAAASRPYQQQGGGQVPYFPPPPVSDRGTGGDSEGQSDHPHLDQMEGEARGLGRTMRSRFEQGKQYVSGNEHYSKVHGHMQEAGIPCQIARSCTKWSHGVPTEHSIANAYIGVIQAAEHFVYIENQFFITATSDEQKPVKNKIGAAIVERIVRAAKAGQKFKVIVCIPAIPGFAGDLKDDASLGTRAIMEFQYNSINRGGHSIMEMIAKEGYDPTEYIRFYNLRNYDRINVSGSMREAEQKSGVDYDEAREQHDEAVELPAEEAQNVDRPKYNQFQQATTNMNRKQGLYTGDWDSVSECYMLGGKDIREVPWQAGDYPEIEAFICIADDRVAIIGSANLNDRSQLGDHDSELAVIVEDPTSVESYMNGQPYRAARFAATLRRQLFRKHLGLLKPQDMEKPDANYEPVGSLNLYDYGSREDEAVMDPLSDSFLNFWNTRAHANTFAFGKIFHPVPHDDVKTWADYDKYYEMFFKGADAEADGKEGKAKPAKYKWGHVVQDEFSPGEQGTKEMKDLLSTIKGSLVEMPLLFLIKEDIAKEGFSLNAFTEEVYT
ncbi:phospholipase D1/2, partial [Lecanoromycetidae sp. Uapishka_2]